jgi:hypothetical protein
LPKMAVKAAKNAEPSAKKRQSMLIGRLCTHKMQARNCGECRPWESCRCESAQSDEHGDTVLTAR